MRTPTNQEDTAMWRDAARRAYAQAKRTKDIGDMVTESLEHLRTALSEDFRLSDEEIRRAILAGMQANP